MLNESTNHQLTIIINDVIETNMAKAAIMPEIKHILLFSSEKLNPQSVTEMVKPVRTITMAAAPIALNMLVMTAIKKPSIAISREIIDAHRHIIGKTYFITDSLALTKEFVKIIESVLSKSGILICGISRFMYQPSAKKRYLFAIYAVLYDF